MRGIRPRAAWSSVADALREARVGTPAPPDWRRAGVPGGDARDSTRGQQSAVSLCDLPHIPQRRGRGYTQEPSQESVERVSSPSDWLGDPRAKKAHRGNDCRRL